MQKASEAKALLDLLGPSTEPATPQQTGLIQNPWAKFEDKADLEVPTATLEIYNYIAQVHGTREGKTEVNRCSMATMCPRRRQYQRQGVQGKPTTPRKLINFMLGVLTEHVLLYYIKHACVGEGLTYRSVDLGSVIGTLNVLGKSVDCYEQPETSFDIGDVHITGHADGWGECHDGSWELIECKSSANWSFQDFKRSGPDDYLRQAHAMMMTAIGQERKVKRVRFFYLRKETGHVYDRVFNWDDAIAQQVRDEFVAVTKDEQIPAPHRLVSEMTGRAPNKKPTGRKVAQFPCTYCPFIEQCKGSHEIEWKADQHGNQSPIYIFK